MQTHKQVTLAGPATLTGIGLHSGAPVRLVIRPAAEDHGIVFERSDLTTGDRRIPARFDLVTDTTLCTLLSNGDGASVSTVEHVMAALAGLGVSNALLTVDGPEVPIMDGSAQPFVDAVLGAGLTEQDRPRRVLRILKPVQVTVGQATASVSPGDDFAVEFEIDFPEAAIGHQVERFRLANGTFLEELSDSRTFCRLHEVEAMRARGLARGGSADNAIIVDRDTIVNAGGLRREKEFVRHKMLDAVGDLALAGGPILGRYEGVRAGHGVTNTLLRALFDTPGAFEWVECSPVMAGHLPGIGAIAPLRSAAVA